MHLPELFKSFKALEYPEEQFEVIFFDNGSVDNSLEVVRREYSRARIISNPDNLGFAAPHRIAAAKARGEILAFLNNDMRVDPRWITEGISYLNPEQKIVCSSSKIFTWDGKNIDFGGGSLQYLGYAEQYQKDEIKDGAPVLFPCGGAMFISRKVFLEADCFDDDYFAVFEDVDLGWRLWMMGYKVVMASRSIVYHKGHATLDSRGEVRKRYLMHKNALVTIIKNYQEDNLKKILPSAMSLALKRALLFLGVDKRMFYFWEKDRGRLTLNKNSIEGLIHLVVLDDVFENFENIREKRDRVQAKRVRKDEEILSMFKDPLRNIMGFKEYFWHEASLIGYFQLYELFNCTEQYRNNLNHGLGIARHDLNRIRREINRNTLTIPCINKPSGRFRDLIDKFNHRRKSEGILNAFRYSLFFYIEKVRRKN